MTLWEGSADLSMHKYTPANASNGLVSTNMEAKITKQNFSGETVHSEIYLLLHK